MFSYVDPRYPGMKPIPCLQPAGSNPKRRLCAMIVGQVYVLPVFNHAGDSYSEPHTCNCTAELASGSDIRTNQYNNCKG